MPFPNLLESGPEWGFWRKWYRGTLVGEPVDWGVQEEIALIDSEEWENGPERIADLIEQIEARFELQACIKELEETLAVVSVDRFGIGGSTPPEPIEDAPQVSSEFTAIWEPIAEFKNET